VSSPARRPVLALALATAFGAGYMPFAPGTWGSLVGLLLWAVLPSSIVVQVAAIAILAVVGTWCGGVAERHFGKTDPAPVVIDEVAGMLITLLLNPVGWTGAIGAFLLFRLADVVKPFPANRLESLPGGLGVMADDAMAAVYANLALRACIWSFGHLVISSSK
jgi:phosphatidylglycerophosphatase A